MDAVLKMMNIFVNVVQGLSDVLAVRLDPLFLDLEMILIRHWDAFQKKKKKRRLVFGVHQPRHEHEYSSSPVMVVPGNERAVREA